MNLYQNSARQNYTNTFARIESLCTFRASRAPGNRNYFCTFYTKMPQWVFRDFALLVVIEFMYEAH